MHTDIHEPIQVLARFREGRVEPLAFRWAGREIRDLAVSLTHTLREGEATLFIIAVSDGASSYELSFNSTTLEWRLRQVWVEG